MGIYFELAPMSSWTTQGRLIRFGRSKVREARDNFRHNPSIKMLIFTKYLTNLSEKKQINWWHLKCSGAKVSFTLTSLFCEKSIFRQWAYDHILQVFLCLIDCLFCGSRGVEGPYLWLTLIKSYHPWGPHSVTSVKWSFWCSQLVDIWCLGQVVL